MAKFISCMRVDNGGFVVIRADEIAAVFPMFDESGNDYTHSVIALAGGDSFRVEETWDQISEAMETDGFEALCRPLA